MAQLKDNVVVHGFSGKLGEILVFRQRAGKTLATKIPVARGPATDPRQQATNTRFQQAVIYGQKVNADPEAKQAYAAAATPGQSAYNVAIADFLHAPDIHEIDLSMYTGMAGQTIRVKVTDNFKVKSVKLSIHNSDGSLQEEGEAVPDSNRLDWIYTTTTDNTNLAGDKITVTTTDNPDNMTTEERNLE